MEFKARALAVSLTVKDVGRSLEWYETTLGFTLDRKHERDGKVIAASIRAGEVRLLLGQDNGAKGWDRKKGEGFSIQLSTDQSIDEIASYIKSKGWAIEAEPADMPNGARMFRLLDPDGFKLVISSK